MSFLKELWAFLSSRKTLAYAYYSCDDPIGRTSNLCAGLSICPFHLYTLLIA